MEAGRSVKAVLNCLGCSIRPSPTVSAEAFTTLGIFALVASEGGQKFRDRLKVGRLALDQ